MSLFAISYDLHKVRNYQPVWDTLKSWNATKVLESLWLVELQSSAIHVRDALLAVVDNDDSLVVIELQPGMGWATRNAGNATNWLRAKIAA